MKTIYLKYAGGALLYGALFYLPIAGMMPANQFITLTVTVLGALFGYHAGKGGNTNAS